MRPTSFLITQLINKLTIDIISWIGKIHVNELINGLKSFNQNKIEGEIETVPCSSCSILDWTCGLRQ